MSRLFYHVMQDNLGNLLFDVSGTMRIAGTGTAATIYGDEALTVILPNPMTNHPSFGSFKCFLPAGDYDFYMAKPGYTFETLTGLQGWGTMALQDASAVTITGGTATLTDLTTTSTLEANGQVGINTPPDPLYALRVQGASYFGTQAGFGTAPSGSHSLEAVSSLISTMTCNSSLHVTGQVAINTAVDPLYSLKVSGASYFATQVGFGTAPAGTHTLFAVSCLISTIDCNGTASKPGGGSWATYTSSQALKEQIAPLTGALDTVLRLQGKTWRWRAEQAELARVLPGPQIGFVLEDIEAVMPQWLCHSLDGRKGYSETGMSALLVEAIRELTARVETLEAR